MKPERYPRERLITVVGCVGAVLLPFGSVLNFGGGSIVLPLLGLEVPGSVVLIVGSLLMLGAIVADNRLSNRKTREQVILETLGAETKE